MNSRAKSEKPRHMNNIPHSQPIAIPGPAENDHTQPPEDDIYIGSPPRETWLMNNTYFTGKPSNGYRQLLFSPKALHKNKSASSEGEDIKTTRLLKL